MCKKLLTNLSQYPFLKRKRKSNLKLDLFLVKSKCTSSNYKKSQFRKRTLVKPLATTISSYLTMG